nr:MAG TPA: hypothetical protein [Caudoviricetes sp.]
MNFGHFGRSCRRRCSTMTPSPQMQNCFTDRSRR